MASQFTHDKGSTEDLVRQFYNTLETMNGISGQVRTTSEQLAGVWTGSAGQKFGGGLDEWRDGFNKVAGGLSDMMTAMQQYEQAQMQAESEREHMAGAVPMTPAMMATPASMPMGQVSGSAAIPLSPATWTS